MSQQKSIHEQIVARAMKEETFRQELLSNPKAAIVRELGFTFSPDVTIQVHEDTPTTAHLVLPMRALGKGGEELSDAELEQATGGGSSDPGPWCCCSGTNRF